MDFTGLGHFAAYKINRPLTEQESADRLDRKHRLHVPARDELAVIKVNSTYIELVDRWYASKGWSVLFSIMLGLPCLAAVIAFPFLLVEQYREWQVWLFVLFMVCPALGLLWVAWYGFRLEGFRQTHYPIRMNRKTRKVHAYRPDGSILEADWDKLYFCIGEGRIPGGSTTYDVRAHVLSKDRKTVLDTFTLAYCYMGDKAGVSGVWEYLRRYMEEPDGAEQSWRYSEICIPVLNRREGAWFGLIVVFTQISNWPALQLVASPIWTAVTVGRWIGMYTSKVPRWPIEVEAQYVVESEDNYVRDWHDNIKLNFKERVWPVICFVVGLSVLIWGALKLGRTILESVS